MARELPTLVFFTAHTSGPARRMESLIAHIARRDRERLRVRRVDADRHPELVEKFAVDEIPALVLVVGKKVVARIDGRASMPQIEELLDEQLGSLHAA